ncbi:hypothetical protein [Pantoea sp. Mhis]|nr:hypothetical protein [Pantoea sp. Mhis]
MINTNGYRLNIIIVIYNDYGQVLCDKRFKRHSRQFPQEGIYLG